MDRAIALSLTGPAVSRSSLKRPLDHGRDLLEFLRADLVQREIRDHLPLLVDEHRMLDAIAELEFPRRLPVDVVG